MSRRGSMGEGSGIAGAIASAIFAGFLLLPALLVVLLFVFFTLMGMVKGTAFRAATLDLPILFTGLVVITATLAVLLLVGVGFLGRTLTPRKRRRA